MKETVLVAEDHQSARELIAAALEGEGYNLVFAATGTEAAQMAGEHPPDAALIDVLLPGIRGSDICRQIKATSRTTPVILISGALNRRELEEESAAAGADAFLAKPFSLDELRTVLRAFSRLRSQGIEIEHLRAALSHAREATAAGAGSARAQLDWGLPYHRFMKLARKAYFEHALQTAGGNKSKLARDSGLDRSTLYVHLRNLGMLRGSQPT
ncbi:MAG: response regulator [Deltaproteobacteria bacterium]|nr:response regulator [Deltaproteobacteria bacterium]